MIRLRFCNNGNVTDACISSFPFNSSIILALFPPSCRPTCEAVFNNDLLHSVNQWLEWSLILSQWSEALWGRCRVRPLPLISAPVSLDYLPSLQDPSDTTQMPPYPPCQNTGRVTASLGATTPHAPILLLSALIGFSVSKCCKRSQWSWDLHFT